MKKVEVKQDVTEISNGEILARYRALTNVQNIKGTKLLYAVHRNKQLLEPFAKAFDDKVLVPLSTELEVYNEAVQNVYKKYADDGVGGVKTKVVIENGKPLSVFDIDMNNLDMKKELAELAKTYSDAIEERNKDIKEYNEFLMKPFEDTLKVFYIPIDIAPSTQEEFDAISFMIADMTPEQEAKFNELFNSLT